MADAEKTLKVVINSDSSQAKEDLTGFNGDLNETGKNISAAFLGVGIAAAAGIGVAVKNATDFQYSMELLQTQAGASTKEVNNMSKSILDMSASVGTGPEELAQALYHIESAGYRGSQALDILKISAEGAKVGNAGLEDVTNALTAAVVSGVSGVKNMSEAMGVLNAIVGAGNMKMQDLATSLSSGILATAKTAGLSIQDVGAALATMTDNGVPAEEATTRLRMSISLLAAPTGQAAEQLKSIGISQLELANDMRSGGIVKAMEDLKEHLDAIPPVVTTFTKGTKMSGEQLTSLQQNIQNTQSRLKILGEEHIKAGIATDKHSLAVTKAQESLDKLQGKLSSANTVMSTSGGVALTASEKFDLLSKAFGGGKSSSTILTLLDQLDRLKSKYKDISGATGEFNEKWVETQKNTQFQIDKLTASLQTMAIEFGNKVLPSVNSLIDFINSKGIPAIQDFAAWVDKNKMALTAIGTVIATVVLPPLILYQTKLAIEGVKAALDFYLASYKVIGSLAVQAVQFGIATTAAIANTIATRLGTSATALWTGAQWLLNIALEANPLGIFIAAVAATAAAIIYAYNHSETFRKIVDFLWEEFKKFIDWLLKEAGPAFSALLKFIQPVIDMVGNLIGLFQKAFQLGTNIGNSMVSMASHKASGGLASGLTLVGEAGPELVNLPQGSYVNDTKDSQKMMGGLNITINNPSVRSDQDITNLVAQIKRALGRDTELARLGLI